MPFLPLPPTPASFLTKPDIHGSMVVFTCEGDLWLGDLKSGAAHRTTSDPGTETNARFSPDGSTIAFTANYEGSTDVYVMPVAGGAPKRLTYDPVRAEVEGWTPDGKSVVFRSRRNSAEGYRNQLFTVPATGGLATMLPVPQAEFGSLAPDGRLAYVPQSNEWMNWYDYRAGAADQVWLADLKGHFRKVEASDGIETTPVWSGTDLFFVSERTGTRNLFRLDPTNGKATQITSFDDAPVRYPGADGASVVFEHGGGLGLYDKATNVVKELQFDMVSDRIRDRELRFPMARFAMHPSLGPTGKRLLFEVRGQIASVAVDEGDMRVVEKKDGSRAMYPTWSPDGTKFAFVSDRSGEYEIWIGSATGSKDPVQLTHGLGSEPWAPMWSPDGNKLSQVDREGRLRLIDAVTGAITLVDQADIVGSYDSTNQQVAWSPDSKAIAFSHYQPNQLQTIYLYDVATAKKAAVTPIGINAYAPAFSPDGKFLLYLADTELNPVGSPINGKYAFDNATRLYLTALSKTTASPFLPKNDEEGPAPAETKAESPIDWDGLADRRIEAPLPAGRYTKVQMVPGKILLLNMTGMATFDGPPGLELQSFDVDKKAVTKLSDADDFEKSFDNKKLMIRHGDGGAVVVDAGTGPVSAAPVSLTAYTLTVKPDQERKQIFEESWRIARDLYYDPGMHGLDWNAVRRKYEARLPRVGDRSDLTRLLIDLVSELRTGHAYINAPGSGIPRIPMGFLGVDLASEGDAAKIVKRYRGDGFAGNRSPLLEPGLGVKEGDYLLAIGGQRIQANLDPQALLVGLAGQTVSLLVNDKPTMEGARTIRVVPLADDRALRYADWVRGRAEYVAKNAGPNYGYLHVPDMGRAGVVGFGKGQFANVNVDGMVYDFRDNGGGFVSSLLLQDIASTPLLWWAPRDGGYWTRESWAIAGYKVALCNENAFSDGELVIEDWKRMNLGPVVGKRTGGGEVGSGNGYALVDGGSIYIPNYGAFGDGKWVIEGYGATPTVEVDQDPAAVMAGRDPQLDRAIAILKAEVAKQPVKRPLRPPFNRIGK